MAKNSEREQARKFAKTAGVKEETMRSRIRRARRLGVDLDEAYQLQTRGGNCTICRHQTPKLRLDHSHQHGGMRGWLCNNCNVGLGLFKDDPHRLRAAADYLERQARTITVY